MLRQYRRLASGGERLRWGILAHMARIAHALALYRRLAVGLVAAVLFGHCGGRAWASPLGRRLQGPERVVRHGAVKRPLGRPPAPARRFRLLASGLAGSLSGPASAARPPPVLCADIGGPAPGLWALGGPGVRSPLVLWAAWPFCACRGLSPAPLSPLRLPPPLRGLLRRLYAAAALSFTEVT